MNYYSARLVKLGTALGFLLLWSACRPERVETFPRIAGHGILKDGVEHGGGLHHGERYCSFCHGVALAGGSQFEPSCYACHGKNWLDESPGQSLAPANHSLTIEGWRHDPAFSEPEANCSECHGLDLQGHEPLHTPSCLLCHQALWQEEPLP